MLNGLLDRLIFTPRLLFVGYLKKKVYRNNPTTLHDLKQNIIQEIGAITPQTLAKTMQNMIKRVDECIRLDGDHLKGIIFKKD